MVSFCIMKSQNKTAEVQAMKVSVSQKKVNASVIDIKKLELENAIFTKEIFGRFKNHSF